MKLDDNGLEVMKSHWLKRIVKNDTIEHESVEDCLRRVAAKVSSDPKDIKENYYLLNEELFTPNTPAYTSDQLAACFVIPIGDSMEEIFDAVKAAALVHKSGGGTGFSFDSIREKGALVKSSSGEASGPVSFMQVFDAQTNVIKQGSIRRGANMGALSVTHPDILEFIHAKEDSSVCSSCGRPPALSNFNLSVKLTNDFMAACIEDRDYDLVSPTGKITQTLPAKKVMEEIATLAWKNGEPGVLFIDTINEANTVPGLGRIETTNPCVPGNTRVITSDGIFPVAQLVRKNCMVAADGRFNSAPSGFFYTKTAKGVRLTTENGYELIATPEHKIMTDEGWKEIGTLKPGDRVILSNPAGLYFGGPGSYQQGLLFAKSGVESYSNVMNFSYQFHLGVIEGLLEQANLDTESKIITISGADLKAVHSMLLDIGVVSKLTDNIVIDSKGASVLASKISPSSPVYDTLHKIANGELNYIETVAKIEETDSEDMYDVSIPGENAFSANGFYVHNCGEQPLLPYEACVLGSINLTKFIKDKEIDYDKLAKIIPMCIRFLDDCIDASVFPLPEIEAAVKRTRKVGLGAMGLADILIELGIPYGSDEAIHLTSQLFEFINREAYNASIKLAEERGSFPANDLSVYECPMRNAARTTVAPNGTTARVFGVSPGIEPIFALCYTKHLSDGRELVFFNKALEETLRKTLTKAEYREAADIVKQTGSIQSIPFIDDRIKQIFRISTEISPEEHLKMQAAVQHNIDNAVSKTIILPNSASVADVLNIYIEAYRLGLKGVTVYRNKSREVEAHSIGIDEKAVRDRGEILSGTTSKIKTGCGSLYVTVNNDGRGACEIIANLGKAGGCAQAQMQAIGKLASVALRAGVPKAEIVDMLSGIRCSQTVFTSMGPVFSCADAIAKTLDSSKRPAKIDGSAQCPKCGAPMTSESGCYACTNPSCGYSKCG